MEYAAALPAMAAAAHRFLERLQQAPNAAPPEDTSDTGLVSPCSRPPVMHHHRTSQELGWWVSAAGPQCRTASGQYNAAPPADSIGTGLVSLCSRPLMLHQRRTLQTQGCDPAVMIISDDTEAFQQCLCLRETSLSKDAGPGRHSSMILPCSRASMA